MNRPHRWLAGVFALALLGGACSTSEVSDTAAPIAATLVNFVAGAVLSTITLAIAGEVGRRQFELTAFLVPVVVLGLITARRYKTRLVGPAVRPVVLGLSAFSAIAIFGVEIVCRTIASPTATASAYPRTSAAVTFVS